jgi:outer membrane protein assembly factor BamB
MKCSNYVNSWMMFRGNARRTGVSRSKPISRPSLQWVTEVGPVVSSPVFDQGNLYISTLTGRVFSFDIGRRSMKWHATFGPLVSSPLLTDSLLIGATFNGWIGKSSLSNCIFAISRSDGHTIWDNDLPGDFFSSPCIMNETVIIGSLNKRIYCLDIAGNLLWTYETDGEIWSSPSQDGEFIYIGSDDGNLYSLGTDGSLRWKTRLNGKIRSSSPCLSEDDPLIYCGTHEGGMYCIDSVTGSIRWSKEIAKPVLSSPIVIEERVIFATSNNAVYCFGSDTGTKLWEFETGDKVWSSPSAVHNDRMLFFGCLDSHIYGLNIMIGKPEWKFPTMGMIDSSPCLANGLLFVCSRDGLLYVFGPTTLPSYIG